MALTQTRPSTEQSGSVTGGDPAAPSGFEEAIGSGDHLVIGRLFVGFSFFYLALSALGLLLAGIDGLTEDGLLGLPVALWSSAPVAFVLLGAIPLLLGLAMHVVPLQIGSPAIAFPRAAALSLWGWVVSSAIFLVGVALDGGIGGEDLESSRLSSVALGGVMVSLSLGAVCVATTVLSHRPLGMGLSKVPFFAWSMLVAAPVWIMTFGSMAAHVFLGRISLADAPGLLERWVDGMAWAMRVPSIYMVAIPALGIAADVVAKAVGRRVSPYGAVQALIAVYAVFSFGAWSQTPRSLQTVLWVLWVLVAAVPVLGVLASMLDTLRRGRPVASSALVAALLVFLLLLGGVLSGALQGLDTAGKGQLFGFDTAALELAQTYFLFGAALLGALAGLTNWGRRVYGAPVAEGQAKGVLAASLLGAGLLATLFLAEGVAGAADQSMSSELLSALAAAGGLLVLLAALGGMALTGGARRSGRSRPDADDDTGLTLEWSAVGAGAESGPEYVNSPYPLLDLRGDADEERS